MSGKLLIMWAVIQSSGYSLINIGKRKLGIHIQSRKVWSKYNGKKHLCLLKCLLKLFLMAYLKKQQQKKKTFIQGLCFFFFLFALVCLIISIGQQ